MGGRVEPRNLDDFAGMSHGISRAGMRNLAKIFCGKLWALLISDNSCSSIHEACLLSSSVTHQALPLRCARVFLQALCQANTGCNAL